LKDENADVRGNAARALGKIKDAHSVSFIFKDAD
jgi:HEAT repeat protein